MKQEVQSGGCWHKRHLLHKCSGAEAAGGERQPVIAWGCGCTTLIFKSWRYWLSFIQNRLSEEVERRKIRIRFPYTELSGATGVSCGILRNLCRGNWNSGLTYCQFISHCLQSQDTTKVFLRQWSRKKWGVLFSIPEPTNQFCKTGISSGLGPPMVEPPALLPELAWNSLNCISWLAQLVRMWSFEARVTVWTDISAILSIGGSITYSFIPSFLLLTQWISIENLPCHRIGKNMNWRSPTNPNSDSSFPVCRPTTHSSSRLVDMFLPCSHLPWTFLKLWIGLNDVIFLHLVQLLHILS